MLYLALKESFYGQNKCLETENFLVDYQKQNCYANCGDIAQRNTYSSDVEVNVNLDSYDVMLDRYISKLNEIIFLTNN